MNYWKPFLLAFVVSAVTSAVTTFVLLSEPTEAASSDSHESADLDRLSIAIASMEAQQADLAKSFDTLAGQRTGGSARLAVGGAEDAVQRWLEANGARVLASHGMLAEIQEPVGEALEQLGGESLETASLASIMEYITSLDQVTWGDDEFWQKLRDSGRIAEVVAEFERLAEEDPTNPELQVALGGAYLQELFGLGSSPESGVLAMKADLAFDAALELDPNHWEARFTKAVSLSNWPAFLGKTGVAIQQFETLIAQQQTMTPDSSHAQTYLYLGNMYQQSGKPELARQTWNNGLALFPNADFLREQLDTNNSR